MKRVLTWDLPLSAAAAFTLSYGVTFVFVIDLPAAAVLMYAAVWCLLFSALARARGALLRALPFSLLLAPAVLFFKAYEPVVGFAERYIAWMWAVRPNPGYERLTVILITFAVTLPVFILIRCRAPAAILLLAGGALFFGLESAGAEYPGIIFWGFLLAVLLQMAHTAGGRGPGADKGLRIVAALPVCFAAVLIAGLIVGPDTDPLSFFRGGVKWGLFSSSGGSFSSDVTGLGRDMGGPFSPSGRLMLTLGNNGVVYGREGPYLRGGVGKFYDGRRWFGDGAEELDLERNVYEGVRTVSSGMMSGLELFGMIYSFTYDEASRLFGDAGRVSDSTAFDPRYRITYVNLRGRRLFLPYGTYYADSAEEGGFSSDLTWHRGDTLRLGQDPGSALDYLAYAVPVWREPLCHPLVPEIPDDPVEEYLDLPDLPLRVYTQARELTAYGDDYYNALSIERYLVENFTYNPDMGQTPSGRDFVDYFLFEQGEGYCTYFATAMAVLCRAAGLPARYVDGFAPSGMVADSPGAFLYTDEYAHAWVEVWIEGYGWMQFEPTPGFNAVEGPVWFPEPVAAPSAPPQTYTPQPSPSPEGPPEAPTPSAGPAQSGGEDRWRAPRLALFTVVLPAGILFFAWLVLRIRRKRFEKTLHSKAYTARQVKRLYTHLLWLVSHANIKPRKHETLGEFADRADEAWPTKIYIMRRAADVYGKSCYSSAPLSEAESATLRHYVTVLEKREHIHLDSMRYWFYTKILSLIGQERKKNVRPFTPER